VLASSSSPSLSSSASSFVSTTSSSYSPSCSPSSLSSSASAVHVRPHRQGETALHMAVSSGRVATVRKLLEQGAAVKYVSSSLLSPPLLAALLRRLVSRLFLSAVSQQSHNMHFQLAQHHRPAGHSEGGGSETQRARDRLRSRR
jgi:hypothetical protein